MMPTNRFDRTAYPGDSAAENGHSSEKGPEALHRLQSQLEELGEYARLYASAKKDAITATVRKLMLWGILGLVAAGIAATAVVTSTVLALVGLAQLIAGALDGRTWAGNVIVGGGLLLLLLTTLVVAILIIQSRLRKQTVKKYVDRHQALQSRFGHDLRQRSESPN